MRCEGRRRRRWRIMPSLSQYFGPANYLLRRQTSEEEAGIHKRRKLVNLHHDQRLICRPLPGKCHGFDRPTLSFGKSRRLDAAIPSTVG